MEIEKLKGYFRQLDAQLKEAKTKSAPEAQTQIIEKQRYQVL